MPNTVKIAGKQSSKRRLKFKDLPVDFAGLCAIYLPRPIHSHEELQDAFVIIDAMAAHILSSEADEYLDAVSQYVEIYEDLHCPKLESKSGLDNLRYLMEENGITQTGLAEILGKDKSLVSKILKGERELTVGHLRSLARRFKVSPELFIDP